MSKVKPYTAPGLERVLKQGDNLFEEGWREDQTNFFIAYWPRLAATIRELQKRVKEGK